MTQTPGDKALAQLVENMAFWSQQGKPEAAMQELERALAVSPTNTDMLAMAARLAFQLGHYKEAASYRAKLRTVAPDDPRLAALSTADKIPTANLRSLEEARRLAAAGEKEAAAKAYREILNGKVPDSLAIEYYTAIANVSPAGLSEAIEGLSHVVERWPNDASFKFAYAQMETFQESTRPAGIDQLRELSHVPDVAARARLAWRDALMWQGADKQTHDQLEAYLAENPSDPALEAKRKEINESLPDEGLLARMRAYEGIEAGNKELAEKEFRAALAVDPNDAEAMIMMSTLVRQNPKRVAEADKLVARAMALAPDRHDEFVNDIGFDPRAPGGGTVNPAVIRAIAADYARVGTFTRQGRYDDAERLLRRLVGKRWNAGAYLSLGAIQSGAGHLPEAEQSYRQAIKADPKSADAVVGLADVLTRAGHGEEVDSLYAQARDLYAKAGNKAGLQAVNRGQAERLRVQAHSHDDLATQIALYRTALAIDPSHAWLRLDLARALQKQGKTAEARAVMAEASAGDRPGTDGLQAAIVFAEQNDNLVEANRLIARLPASELTPQMREDQERLAAKQDVERAMATGSRATVRAQLLALAARPDPTGARGTEIGSALIRLNDKPAVRNVVAAGLANTPSPTAQQRLSYAGVLLGANLSRDASTLVSGLNRGSLTKPQQTNLDQLLNGIALQQSDQILARNGRPVDALTVLTPRLTADPQNTDLNLGLSRIYQTDGKSADARALTDALLQRNPDDVNVHLAAIDTAMALRDSDRAGRLIAEGIALFPDDPQFYVRSANLARSKGLNRQALTDLTRARELRQKQLQLLQDKS